MADKKQAIRVCFELRNDQYPNDRIVSFELTETVADAADGVEYLKARIAEAVHEKLEIEMDPKIKQLAAMEAELTKLRAEIPASV